MKTNTKTLKYSEGVNLLRDILPLTFDNVNKNTDFNKCPDSAIIEFTKDNLKQMAKQDASAKNALAFIKNENKSFMVLYKDNKQKFMVELQGFTYQSYVMNIDGSNAKRILWSSINVYI